MMSCKYGNLSMMEYALQEIDNKIDCIDLQNGGINQLFDRDYYHVLYSACKQDNVHIVKLLVEKYHANIGPI